ncbi:MAG: hypothetical protein NT157_01100 [Candidatus Micrarchaeota archaeon]|nr:hypothetical protein [Candidatus Micrarchaeota archaeon]
MRTSTIMNLAAASAILMGAALLYSLYSLPRFGSPILDSANYILQAAAEKTGAANIVCSIVLDFRGYDTLGEATVLLTSVLGVFVALAGREKGREK